MTTEKLAGEWYRQHEKAAAAEGWGLFDCDGSMYGPWQVQKFDDTDGAEKVYGVTVPLLEDDDAVMKLIAFGKEPHHVAVKEFLKEANPREYAGIMAWWETAEAPPSV